ncbi:hypothetical protein P4S63_26015 [Pseudoalteromonas sp. B193]
MSLDEYGHPRKAKLVASKGKLIVMPKGAGVEAIKQTALAEVSVVRLMLL